MKYGTENDKHMLMIDESKNNAMKIGLALSGGGYRAAGFHLGVLRKLHELAIIEDLHVISTISGGSIIGAFYALNSQDFDQFQKTFAEKLQKSCIKLMFLQIRFWLSVLGLCMLSWILAYDPFSFNTPRWLNFLITVTLLLSFYFFQFRIISFTKLKIGAYKRIFFGNKTIADLPSKPILAINATNLSTGTLWTFSKKKCSDSSYEFPKDGGSSITFDCGKMPLAMAVASSTSVPVPFDPVKIPKVYFKNKEDFKRVNPRLIDGGLYDNQGIHKITQANSSYHCNVIIVSDGSQPFGNLFRSTSTISVLYRGIDVMMRKIKNLQFIRDVYSGEREIAYFSIDWEYTASLKSFVASFKRNQIPEKVASPLGLTEMDKTRSSNDLINSISDTINFKSIVASGLNQQEISEISSIGTNLTALTPRQIDLLSRHGATLCELQLKLHCPYLNKSKKLNI